MKSVLCLWIAGRESPFFQNIEELPILYLFKLFLFVLFFNKSSSNSLFFGSKIEQLITMLLVKYILQDDCFGNNIE